MSNEQKEKIRKSNLGKRHNLTPDGRATLQRLSHAGWNKGKECSLEWRNKIRLSLLGKKRSLETRLKQSLSMRGDKNHNFIDGKMRDGKKHYYDIRWKVWRDCVFKRDKWTCQDCGKVGGKIEPHHIKSWTYFPQSRYEVSNGLTLCKLCHKKTDNYCGRGIKRRLTTTY